MTPARLEELRQLAGAVDGPKSAWMDELIEEVDLLRTALENLWAEIPAIGHHELEKQPPIYDCPKLNLAKAMNAAALILGKPIPYPKVFVKCDCGSPWHTKDCAVMKVLEKPKRKGPIMHVPGCSGENCSCEPVFGEKKVPSCPNCGRVHGPEVKDCGF